MDLEMVNEAGDRVPVAMLRSVASRADRILKLPPRTRLEVVLVSDRTIRELNRRTRRNHRATDVLSFPLFGGRERRVRQSLRRDPCGWIHLGTVVISEETAARQAAERKRTRAQEIKNLFTHGLLHVVGYDHRNAAEERRMNALAARLMDSRS